MPAISVLGVVAKFRPDSLNVPHLKIDDYSLPYLIHLQHCVFKGSIAGFLSFRHIFAADLNKGLVPDVEK